MNVKLLTEHHLEFLSLEVCTGSSESTLVKIPHCWKSLVAAHIKIDYIMIDNFSYTAALIVLGVCEKTCLA